MGNYLKILISKWDLLTQQYDKCLYLRCDLILNKRNVQNTQVQKGMPRISIEKNVKEG